MSKDLQELNSQLRCASYVAGGAEPSAKDAEALKDIFGDDMKALNWAARMASYAPSERLAMSGAATSVPAKPGAPAKVQLSKVKCSRDIGGAEGCVDNSPIDKLTNRPLDWPVKKVRQTFVDFMTKEKKMTFVPSSPSVPMDDPTLLFANAGMNQFKSIFLGTVEPGTDMAKLKGACNSQKCIRAGGKHNDLDDVGRDTYHHTFFEMLGNWSFGDYFKEEAIAWSFQLLTEVYKIPADRLYATYFEGSKENGLSPDLEAKEIWKKYLPEDHILPGDMKDNFWEMGDIGPCGPCSEIHYDRVGGRNAAHLVNMDDPLVLEVWNLVFMTHMRTEKGLKELPNKHVDTGMGLERIASVLQGVYSNYNTDLWWNIFAKLKEISQYPHDYHSSDAPKEAIVAYRVVADHIRTTTIALTDGGVPDNAGRGYVLRRIIRRAVRFGKQTLNAPLGFLSQLVPVVVDELGDFFPELRAPKNVERVQALILDEEKAFDKTWTTGIKHFNDALKKNAKMISGEDAFILHDRYGFPIDLTLIMAEEKDCKVDLKKFHEIDEQRKPSSHSMKLKQYLDVNNIDTLQKAGVPATNDDSKYVWEVMDAKIIGLVDKGQDALVDEIGVMEKPKDKKKAAAVEEHMCVIVDRTNYYYESGGQIWDTGFIVAKDGSFKVKVNKVLSMGGYICHIGQVESGTVKKGAEVSLKVDFDRRLNIGANHTGTHQLNYCLRDVLEYRKGSFTQVNQKGSLVEDGFMRFDFSWNEKLSKDDILATEELLRKSIADKLPVYDKLVPLKEATEIHGVRQMFGEKYPDPVRVVSIGKPVEDLLSDPKNEEWKKYSIEFCGGTHLKSLEEIQTATIVGEDALMKGVRRMTVLTRGAAQKAFADLQSLKDEYEKIRSEPHNAGSIDDKIKKLSVHQKKVGDTTLPIVDKSDLFEAIGKEVKELHAEKKKLVSKIKEEALKLGKELGAEAKGKKEVIIEVIKQWGADRDALNEVASGISKEHPGAKVFLLASDSAKGKGLALTSVPKGTDKSAVDWIKAACGKGGGNAEKAQTGFAPSDEEKVLKAAVAFFA